jgi:hypothetical protein
LNLLSLPKASCRCFTSLRAAFLGAVSAAMIFDLIAHDPAGVQV